MAKLLIKPIPESGVSPFTIEGPYTVKDWPDDGKIYYINGDSFPEEIVEVLEK